ncbi:MAG: hypothetical protein A2745_01095 [Candidatus Harrisonbacteria bacterium RIFCSPHIGHO2_01_FULL_44_13]|uniref:R3H domain-containing protein n=1 Tax=Candidatus Harrisonbacteria bacterium RIFCSPLOWO2_01_FULL_44_18 TaxID=1798407 RepID=A0A1G1ZM99_9BACT|nr:MAG: hypothetical protein A2745_01095 [Candidatus Harrisonbacteria bacterium RIFCSPHIGHO2_01_FULL_44_13]OGY65722.1 MAG: hypothetical protein A3A16_03870 [Candidatus Harrisonbacteria bacterium RIFCSPLOWO2_01_FULL_44_18]
MGLNDLAVNFDSENKKLTVFINEGEWLKKWLPYLVADLEHIVRLLTKKHNQENVFVDINNYRKEREEIILQLAKAAAQKALLNKEEIKLPAMNAYERRLVHVELATRPDVKTESIGEGKERYVIVKPI